MSRKGIFILLLLSLVVVSCEKVAIEVNESAAEELNETIPETACTVHWECAGGDYRAYVLENCTRTQLTKCERGCLNGTCQAAPICTVGFKCIDQNRKGYQKEDCSYVNKETCDFGCEKGKCREKSVNETNTTTAPAAPKSSYAAENEEDNTTAEPTATSTLKLGEQQEFEFSGAMHTISIYNLEAGRAIIKVDGIKSDWIAEGGSFTYGNIGTTIHIETILFQSYGTKAIEYSVS